jgi:hypothetical protein
MSVTPVLQPFYAGWATHQQRLLAAIADLSRQQLALRPAPDQMTIWQLASHMAGSRAYWFHDVLGEGDPAIRDMFRVASTTVPGLPLEDAGWEDDESHPRTTTEIVDAFHLTWGMVAPSRSLSVGPTATPRAGGWPGTSWSTTRITAA